MPDIAMRFGNDMLTLEGAMGTMLQRQGIPADACPAQVNVLDPEVVSEIHRYYRLAGANCAITNTFGGSRAKLDQYGIGDQVRDINQAGVLIAKKENPEHVLGDVGPCGLVMEPLGTATFDEVYAQYFEQISALASAEPDAILIETMIDIADARCAVLAGRAACDLPIMVTCTFNEQGLMDLSGTDPATAAIILEAAGASAVGLNCGLGPEKMYPLLQQMAAVTELPLIIQPNAGMPKLTPKGETVYPGTADEMAYWAARYRELGAQMIGSCCGSTPAFTGAIYATIGHLPVIEHKAETGGIVLAGPRGYVRIGHDRPTCLIGERINPTGKKKLAAELREGVFSTVRAFAAVQKEAGASALEVNVGTTGVDEGVVLPEAVKVLTGCSGMPLSIDTPNMTALEEALRIFPGRALINSCNGADESMDTVLPLAKKYGAAVICLALDGDGIPKTVEGRLDIVRRIRARAHAFGLADDDLVIDTLTMTAAADEHAPEVTLGALQAVTEMGLCSSLGVSNVSHGLPDRPLLNAAFIGAASACGLTAVIANPNDRVVAESVRVGSDARLAGTSDFDDAFSQWKAAYSSSLSKAEAGISSLADDEGTGEDVDPATALRNAIFRGDAQGAPALVDRCMEAGIDSTAIIPDILTPAIQEFGDAYGRKEVFLPQLMVAADAMKAAVERVKETLPHAEGGTSSGNIVFCTVKGDIHSIGKGICVSILESQGFTVRDLGVDVAPEKIIAAAREMPADVVCLSALMTTTLDSMKKTVALLLEELPDVTVMVGGAVVTEDWADSIHAAYTADAPACAAAIAEVMRGKKDA